MGDRITETRETGFGGSIIASIKGIAVGLVLFLASFVILWWNEGRTDLSKLAQKSIPISADSIDSTANGEFVSVTGGLSSDKMLKDPDYLRFGSYIALNRNVEMFAWVEHKSTRKKKKAGGRKVSEATYRYEKEWSDKPPASSSFKEPTGHDNPRLLVREQSFRVKSANIAAYRFNPETAQLPHPLPVKITEENFIRSPNTRLDGGYIYSGAGSLVAPEVGDIRISYTAVFPGTRATLFGKLVGDIVSPHFYETDKKFYRAVKGSREEAVAELASEHRVTMWILRIVGFLMMWIGLNLIVGPVNAVLDFIPALGTFSRSMIGTIMLGVALGLTLLTIIISMIAHNLLWFVIVTVGLLGIIWGMTRFWPKQQPAEPEAKSSTLPLSNTQMKKRPVVDEDEAMMEAVQQRPPSQEKMEIECEKCGRQYTVPVSIAGRKVKCKDCGHKFYLPTTIPG